MLKFKPQIMASDCTIISALSTSKTAPTSLQTANNNMLKHHLYHESKKSNRPTHKNGSVSTSGESIVQLLNELNITLFPFAFYKNGSMGPLVTSYFLIGYNTPSVTDPKI